LQRFERFTLACNSQSDRQRNLLRRCGPRRRAGR
jgi:hypothetical protein